MTTTRIPLICGDCTDEITPDEQSDAFHDPDSGEWFHHGCTDRDHDLRTCDCRVCDEDRADDPNWGRIYSPGIRIPEPCGHEDVSNSNPVRSPNAVARYECSSCSVVMVETEPGCYEPANDDRAVRAES